MALTISSHPSEVITNAPEFTVSTSLSEGASYQNLRIRATVYAGGETEAVAVLEQPKGLDDWVLFDVLKSLCGRCTVAPGGGDVHVGPTISSELLTGWTEDEGDFTSFTSSGREITTAVTTISPDHALSNDLGSVAAGDVLVVACENDYSDSGGQAANFRYGNSGGALGSGFAGVNYAGLSSGEMQANHIYFFLCHEAEANPRVYVGSETSGVDFSGTFSVRKITAFAGSPAMYFKVRFQEVYENASNVTTMGGSEWTDTMLFVPAHVRPGEAFSDYLITASGKNFLSRQDGIPIVNKFYKHGIGMELRMMYASVSAYLRASMVVDAGTNTENDLLNAGWGMLVVNGEGGFTYDPDAEDETIGFTLSSINLGGGIIYTGASTNVYCETNCHADVRAVSFVGALGEEVILFRGLHSETGKAEKTYYQSVNRVRKVLRSFRYVRHKLRMLHETEDMRRLLHELAYAEGEVWMYDSDFDEGYREVTVVDDEVRVTDKRELFESEIDVEYYE